MADIKNLPGQIIKAFSTDAPIVKRYMVYVPSLNNTQDPATGETWGNLSNEQITDISGNPIEVLDV